MRVWQVVCDALDLLMSWHARNEVPFPSLLVQGSGQDRQATLVKIDSEEVA